MTRATRLWGARTTRCATRCSRTGTGATGLLGCVSVSLLPSPSYWSHSGLALVSLWSRAEFPQNSLSAALDIRSRMGLRGDSGPELNGGESCSSRVSHGRADIQCKIHPRKELDASSPSRPRPVRPRRRRRRRRRRHRRQSPPLSRPRLQPNRRHRPHPPLTTRLMVQLDFSPHPADAARRCTQTKSRPSEERQSVH